MDLVFGSAGAGFFAPKRWRERALRKQAPYKQAPYKQVSYAQVSPHPPIEPG